MISLRWSLNIHNTLNILSQLKPLVLLNYLEDSHVFVLRNLKVIFKSKSLKMNLLLDFQKLAVFLACFSSDFSGNTMSMTIFKLAVVGKKLAREQLNNQQEISERNT